MDPHDVLGVAPDATDDEILAAYRVLVRRHHPDRHVAAPPPVQAAEAARMAEVTGAFTLLNDPTALARHRARSSRAAGTPGGGFATGPGRSGGRHDTPDPGAPDPDVFDYRRAARAEFEDPAGGRWGRTPPPRPTREPTGPRRPRRPGRRRRWVRPLAWLALVAVVVGTWLVASDTGQTVWAILGGVVEPGPAAVGVVPGMPGPGG